MSGCDAIVPVRTGVRLPCGETAVVRVTLATAPALIPMDYCQEHLAANLVPLVQVGHDVRLERLDPRDAPITRAAWEQAHPAPRRRRNRRVPA